MKRLTLAALLLATATLPSFAQSSAHDHGQQDAPAGQQSAPSKGQSGMGGMMGGGMMKNMGGRMPMTEMMQTTGMLRPGGHGMGMATIDRVEARIAFLRTELKITDAQNAAWNAFADALRANARSLGEVRTAMAGASQQGLVERFGLQEKWLAARLEGTRAIKAALANLVGLLSDEQTKAADELLAPHMGMMAMTQGGQTGAGAMPTGR